MLYAREVCSGFKVLTHWTWDKEAAIVQMTVLYKFSLIKTLVFLLKFDGLLFLTILLIDNMAALIQVVAWRQTGDKPLSEPMTA